MGRVGGDGRMLELRLWLQSVDTFDFCDFNVWPVATSLFINRYKGTKARNDARSGNLAKHEWILVYAIDEDTTIIPESLLKDIMKTLRRKYDCGTQDQIDKAMLRSNVFRRGVADGQVGLHKSPS